MAIWGNKMDKELLTIQVVGFKNSGKTTLVCNLIELATQDGWKVASLKHHGHGGTPNIVENTDSERHKQAGSIMAGVEGEGLLHLSISQSEWTLKKILAFYKQVDIDLLIIEGYKNADFPKIVLISKKDDLYLLNDLTNIAAIISSLDLPLKHGKIPVFSQNELSLFIIWFLEFIRNKLSQN